MIAILVTNLSVRRTDHSTELMIMAKFCVRHTWRLGVIVSVDLH